MNRFVSLSLLILATCFATSAAHAEGCDSTPQPLNAQEKAFYSKFTTLRAAIPQPPAGWQVKQESQEKLAQDYEYMPTERCPGENYYQAIEIGYERPMSQEDSDKEMAAMQAPADPAKQKKVDELTAQQQAIMQKMMDAAQKQDYKGMEAIGKQNDEIGKQLQAAQLEASAGSRASIEAIQRDRDASVDISINDAGGVSCYGSPKAIQVPGAIAYDCQNPATYSSPGEVLDKPKGRVVVVYGPAEAHQYDWNRKDAQDKDVKDSYVEIKTSADANRYPQPAVIVVDISGDDLARAESLYKQMNLKPLAALIKH